MEGEMRVGGFVVALSATLATLGVAQAQRILGPMPTTPAVLEATASPLATAAAAAFPAAPAITCANPDALNVARVVEIDTTGGPGFGFEHFKAYDFLRPGEVILTFDDGPWPHTTAAVLAALAAQCTKALFFPIGKHSMWHPEILKQVAEQGHTIGSHTWSHVDLSKLSTEDARAELEKGISAVRAALGKPAAPFFRFPALRHPPEVVAYLGTRNIGIWSTDMDSFDFKMRRAEQVVQSVMAKLKKHGKGIVLMHDFQKPTASAVPELLAQLKAGGYKVVQVKAKDPVETMAEFDDAIMKEFGGSVAGARPIGSVVRTISE
jgi:peptidoglycan/xylan/chitin deacetylase (PgdA/CDA1 family)